MRSHFIAPVEAMLQLWASGVSARVFLLVALLASVALVRALWQSAALRTVPASEFLANVRRLVQAGNVPRALRLAESTPSAPVCALAAVGLRAARDHVAAHAGGTGAVATGASQPTPGQAARAQMEAARGAEFTRAAGGLLAARLVGAGACAAGAIVAARIAGPAAVAAVVVATVVTLLVGATWWLERQHAGDLLEVVESIAPLCDHPAFAGDEPS